MISQKVYIPSADWCVEIFYDVTPDDREYVMDALSDLGINRRDEVRAYRQLSKWEYNLGLTHSSLEKRKSVMVIGHADSIAQFLNTLAHEKQHLEMSIVIELGLNPYGETAAYISGDILEAIYNEGKKTLEYVIYKLLRFMF